MTRLSKSRIMASLQCHRRVYLEARRPELARYSKRTQAAFAQGHAVGDLAVELYGSGQGIYVEYGGRSLAPALRQTRQLLDSMFHAPVFEATLEHDGVLVREDVLLPTAADGRESWRIVEVKSSTRVKPEHVHDCAVQAWVHLESGYPLAAIALAHVDNTFVYPGDGQYDGLLIENDLTESVFGLLSAVPRWIEQAREAVEGSLPEVPVGQHCTDPYDCPFLHICWPQRGEDGVEYPISGLGGSKKQLGTWLMNGYRDLRDVPATAITSEAQLRIHRITHAGRPELLAGARKFAAELAYPRFYLDFETIAPAIPRWPGTRPYQTLPIQWSCHIERAPDRIEHEEFLDLSGEPPMRALAKSLILALEADGPVLMYTPYERTVIEGLAVMYPDLSASLEAIVGRLVDLAPVTRANYYHPDMLGSWSIKAVLPTVAPDMDYTALDGIQEGTEASAAYLEAIDPATPPERKGALGASLLSYCRHDTEAMLRLVQFFALG